MFITKAAASCVAMVAALATLAACGGADSANPKPSPTGSNAGSAAAGSGSASGTVAAPGSSTGGSGVKSSTASGSGTGAPASGTSAPSSTSVGYGGIKSLTPKQKTYVRKHAPAGIDPAVVVQAGVDICARLENVASINKDDLLSALVVKQISGAPDAIRYMCPKLLPELRIAQRGFVDGSYAVSSSRSTEHIVAGRYRTIAATKSCVWTGFNAKNVAVLSGRMQSAQRAVTLSIGASVRRFESQGCSVWVPV